MAPIPNVGFRITEHTIIRWLILRTNVNHAMNSERDPKHCRLTELFYSDMFDQYMADTNGPSSFARCSDKLLIPVARAHTMTG